MNDRGLVSPRYAHHSLRFRAFHISYFHRRNSDVLEAKAVSNFALWSQYWLSYITIQPQKADSSSATRLLSGTLTRQRAQRYNIF